MRSTGWAGVLMLASSPPLLAGLSVAVWASLGRPILYRQERVGRDGKRFAMLKFRSMRPPADPKTAPLFGFPRTRHPEGSRAPTGAPASARIMRHLSLDELPQLINVVKGDMSFIGPRPERPEFVDVFEQTVHRYGERHRVKSGITGWAQVHGLRGKTSIADRVEWDNYYIENWSLWLDLKIVLLRRRVVGSAASSELDRFPSGARVEARAARTAKRMPWAGWPPVRRRAGDRLRPSGRSDYVSKPDLSARSSSTGHSPAPASSRSSRPPSRLAPPGRPGATLLGLGCGRRGEPRLVGYACQTSSTTSASRALVGELEFYGLFVGRVPWRWSRAPLRSSRAGGGETSPCGWGSSPSRTCCSRS